jgi:hemerythrin
MNTKPDMTAAFTWHEDFAVGHEAMDETHHEFVQCVDAMLRADDSELSATLEAFADHARRHFGAEDQAMRETGYGSAGCHVDEHAAVLKSVDEVRKALALGHTHVVRSFAQALADWFPEHASVMDMGLARWLVQSRLGGSPVVIRRREAATV